MRPHQLSMKAFGPFAEKTVVDFDRMGNNIFLIAGDTGIGKTTIFDGMIYALYGKASGLSRSSLGTESFHSDYCKEGNYKAPMEVTFTFSNAGRTYTVSRTMNWGVKGNSQTVVKESTLSENGTVILHGKGREDKDDVTRKIQEILGLDADQFRRIIMLAQGEFQKFLTSGSDERGKILGKLFDNRRHIDLQMRLKAAFKMVENRLDTIFRDIQREIGYFSLSLTDEQQERLSSENPNLLSDMNQIIAEIEEERRQLSVSIQETETERMTLHGIITRAEDINRRLTELEQTKAKLLQNQQQTPVIEDKKKKLAAAKNAKELIPLEKTAADAREQLNRLQNTIQQLRLDQETLRTGVADRQANAAAVAEKNRPLIEANTKQRNDLERILSLYDEYSEAASQCRQKEIARQNASAKASQAQQSLEKTRTSLQAVQSLLDTLDHAGEQTVKEAQRLLEEQETRKTHLLKLEQQMKALKQQEKELAALSISVHEAQIAAQQAEKKHCQLNGAFLSGQAGLLAQEMRNELQTNPTVHCPVCGSQHTVADIDAFAVCCEDTPTREQVDQAFAAWTQAQNAADKSEKDYTGKQASYERDLAALLERSAEWIGVTDQETLWQGIALSEAKIQCESAIKKCRSDYQKALDEKRAKDKAVQNKALLEAEAEKWQGTFTNAQEALQKAAEEYSEAKARADEKRNALEGFPPSKQAAQAMIRQLRDKTEHLQSAIDEAEQDFNRHQNRLAGVNGRLATAEAEQETAKEKERQTRFAFEEGLVRYGFGHRDEYEAAMSPNGLRLYPDDLDSWIRSTERSINTYEQECRDLEKAITRLTQETEGCEQTDLKDANEKMQTIEQNLKTMREKEKELSSQISAKETACGHISVLLKEQAKYRAADMKLYPLSTVANGTLSFSRYILVDFFRRIIERANVHLDMMTDGEYALIYKKPSDGRRLVGLDLKVYNSITRLDRETASLSGGQLFEASLSLALGLSDVVQMESSSTIQIDSMFIDEGFGSLDSTRLEKSIEVLSRLSSGQRQIGIISHVARLDECLPKKICVRKKSNGQGSEIYIETDE